MMSKSKSSIVSAQQAAIDRRDPLGLTITDWAEIGKIASEEAIRGAHAAGFATTWEGNDGKLYQTRSDGTIVECQQ